MLVRLKFYSAETFFRLFDKDSILNFFIGLVLLEFEKDLRDRLFDKRETRFYLYIYSKLYDALTAWLFYRDLRLGCLRSIEAASERIGSMSIV